MNMLLYNLFSVLKDLKQTSFIFTMSNSDLRSDLINYKIKYFCKKYKNAHFFKSLSTPKLFIINENM